MSSASVLLSSISTILFFNQCNTCPTAEGYNHCAWEGETCNFIGIIAFGATGYSWQYFENLLTSVECTAYTMPITDHLSASVSNKECCKLSSPPNLTDTSYLWIEGSVSCGQTISAYTPSESYIMAWQFILNSTANVTIDDCDSSFDTTLWLLTYDGSDATLMTSGRAGADCTDGDDCVDTCGANCCVSALHEKFTITDLEADTYYVELRPYYNFLDVVDNLGEFVINIQCMFYTALTSVVSTAYPIDTVAPSKKPTSYPTFALTKKPTADPITSTITLTKNPTSDPTIALTKNPTADPITSTKKPTVDPTIAPIMMDVTLFPSSSPNRESKVKELSSTIAVSSEERQAINQRNDSALIIATVSAAAVCICCLLSFGVFYFKSRIANKNIQNMKNNITEGGNVTSVEQIEMSNKVDEVITQSPSETETYADNVSEKANDFIVMQDMNAAADVDVDHIVIPGSDPSEQILSEEKHADDENTTNGNDLNVDVELCVVGSDSDMDDIPGSPSGVLDTAGKEIGEEPFNVQGDNDEYRVNEDGANEVKEWLDSIGFSTYYDTFIKNGFDSMDFLKEINDVSDLNGTGISLRAHQLRIVNHIKKLKQ